MALKLSPFTRYGGHGESAMGALSLVHCRRAVLLSNIRSASGAAPVLQMNLPRPPDSKLEEWRPPTNNAAYSPHFELIDTQSK